VMKGRDMADEREHLVMLIETIKLLAADYETQVKQFPPFVLIPDEIALTYYDCFLLAQQIAEGGLIDEHQLERLTQIDRLLEEMTEDREHNYWTLDALRTESKWESIRSAANDLLALFGQTYQPPNLYWIQYIG
jgi:hypothetical protein